MLELQYDKMSIILKTLFLSVVMKTAHDTCEHIIKLSSDYQDTPINAIAAHSMEHCMEFCKRVLKCKSAMFDPQELLCRLYGTAEVPLTRSVKEAVNISGGSKEWAQKMCYIEKECQDIVDTINTGTKFVISKLGKDLFIDPETLQFEWRRTSPSLFTYNEFESKGVKDIQTGLCFTWTKWQGLRFATCCSSQICRNRKFTIVPKHKQEKCLWEFGKEIGSSEGPDRDDAPGPGVGINVVIDKDKNTDEDSSRVFFSEQDFLGNLTTVELRFELERPKIVCKRFNISHGQLLPSKFSAPLFFTGDKMKMRCDEGFRFVGNKQKGVYNRTYVCERGRRFPRSCSPVQGSKNWIKYSFAGILVCFVLLVGVVKLTAVSRKCLGRKSDQMIQVNGANKRAEAAVVTPANTEIKINPVDENVAMNVTQRAQTAVVPSANTESKSNPVDENVAMNVTQRAQTAVVPSANTESKSNPVDENVAINVTQRAQTAVVPPANTEIQSNPVDENVAINVTQAVN